LEGTRIRDANRAFAEAMELYGTATKDAAGTVTKADLDAAYSRTVLGDLKKRFGRMKLYHSGLFANLLGKDTHRYWEKLRKEIAEIEERTKGDPSQRRAQIAELSRRNAELLRDMDRMVGHDGSVDAVAYWIRFAEKFSKGVANALMIDTAFQLSSAVFGHVADGSKAVWEWIGRKMENGGGTSGATAVSAAPLPPAHAVAVSESTAEKVAEIVPKVPKSSEVEIRKGDSVWRVMKRILAERSGGKGMNAVIASAVAQMREHPSDYGLSVKNIDRVTVEDLRGIQWEKAVADGLKKSASK
jgi:hypothetical protein